MHRWLRPWPWLLAGLVLGFSVPYLWWLQQLLDRGMAAASWSTPTRVYAQPLELELGEPLDEARLIEALEHAGYRPGNGTEAGTWQRNGGRYRVATRGLLGPPQLLSFRLDRGRVRELSSPGGRAQLDPAVLGELFGGPRDSRPVRLGDVPPLLVYALQAVEDRRFKDHSGVSIPSILRALWVNLRSGEIVQGGSTLTQQLVKTLFLTRDRRWLRKFHEAVLAVMVEWHYGKDQILEAYINEVFMGQDGHRAIHGMARAAEHYFGRHLAELDAPRIALLVGLLRGPSYYDPWRHPERARARRDQVLDALYDTGMLTRSQRDRAQAAPLGLLRRPGGTSGAYPSFLALVRDQLAHTGYGGERGGGRVVSTLVPAVQSRAEAALTRTLAELEQSRAIEAGSLQGAVVVVDYRDGSVLAAVGDRRPRFAGFNRVRDARRPVGSLIKPFVYLTALRDSRWHLASRLDDSPLRLELEDGKVWSPDNFDEVSHGPVRLIDALVHSYNQASARLGVELGVDRVIRELRRLGLARQPAPHPSLLLGAVELSPLEVAQLFASLANGARQTPLNAVSRALREEDGSVYTAPRPSAAGDPVSGYLLRFALERVAREGTASSVLERLGLGLAGKTGTSNGFRDSWFAGFAGDRLAVVWVGRDDNAPAGVTGAGAALKIFEALFASLSWEPLPAEAPAEIEWHWVSGVPGRLADDRCPDRDYLPFAPGRAPEEWAECARKRGWRFWPFNR